MPLSQKGSLNLERRQCHFIGMASARQYDFKISPWHTGCMNYITVQPKEVSDWTLLQNEMAAWQDISLAFGPPTEVSPWLVGPGSAPGLAACLQSHMYCLQGGCLRDRQAEMGCNTMRVNLLPARSLLYLRLSSLRGLYTGTPANECIHFIQCSTPANAAHKFALGQVLQYWLEHSIM